MCASKAHPNRCLWPYLPGKYLPWRRAGYLQCIPNLVKSVYIYNPATPCERSTHSYQPRRRRRISRPVLLKTTYIDSFIKSIHHAERKSVAFNCPPAPIILVPMAGSEDEIKRSGTRQEISEDSALLMKSIRCDRRYITVTYRYFLKRYVRQQS